MQPEVVRAVERLVAEGVLSPDNAALPLRSARGELLSVRFELRILFWLGVSLIAAGSALLVKTNLDRIGPLAVAVALGVVAFLCLAWVARVAPAFSWGSQASPNLAFDYILLLGATLAGAELAFLEVNFTVLGRSWPWHLFLASLLYAALSVRYDSRLLFSLALSTFAAWRGVAIRAFATGPLGHGQPALVRVNAVACGALFVLVAWVLQRFRRKSHFEPVAAYMGWLLVLGGLGSGILDKPENRVWAAWAGALLVAAAALAWGAACRRRFGLFAMGVVGTYAAISRFVVEALQDWEQCALWFLVSSVVLVALLAASRRRLSEEP